MADIIWKTPCGNQTELDAARRFAREYFAEPRGLEHILFKDPSIIFMVSDGIAEYKVIFVPLVHGVSSSCWGVIKI